MRALTVIMVTALAVGGAARAEEWGDQKVQLGPKGSPSYTAFAQSFAKSQAICRAVRNAKPPPADLPTPKQAAALKACDSEALYYGQKGPPDYVKARQCAFAESNDGETSSDEVFSGLTILAQVYANGLGVPRNLDLAIHYACNIDGADAEIDGRVTHLAQIKAKGPGKDPFDYCDDITSGLAEGYCAAHAQNLDNTKRQAGLAALAARVPPPARGAYAALRKAAEAFAISHGENEVDLSGTGRAAFTIEAQEQARDAFGKALRQLLDGKVPAATPAQAKAADDALNVGWRKLRGHGEKLQDGGTVVLSDVVRTQRLWIAYRDAFTAFAKALGKSADGVFVQVTRARTAELADVAG